MTSANSSPRVTIGMPVYNGAEFIERALAGLSQQTFRDFLVLVSDNVSTDGTWEILQRWAERDERIVLRRQPTNIGALPNFHDVLQQTDSEFFMWHAHDDWLAPNYLAELVACLEAKPECALACATVEQVTPTEELKRRILFPDLTGKSRLERVRTLLKNPEPTRIYGLFRTQFLKQKITLQQQFDYVWAADLLLLAAFALNDQICGTNRTGLYYRRTGLSVGRYHPNTFKERWRFIRRYGNWHWRLWRTSELPLSEKLRCWPPIWTHFFKTTESIIKRPLKYAIKKWVSKPLRFITGRARGSA